MIDALKSFGFLKKTTPIVGLGMIMFGEIILILVRFVGILYQTEDIILGHAAVIRLFASKGPNV